MTTREPNGFYFITARRLSSSQPLFRPEAVAIESEAQLCWLRERLGIEITHPIDFTRYFVFAFALPRTRFEGAEAEPTRLLLSALGVLKPELAFPYRIQVLAQDWAEHVRVVAVARTAVPRWGFLYRAIDGKILQFALSHPSGRTAVPEPAPEVAMPPLTRAPLGRVILPELRGVQLQRLDDGSFVWVVRHADATASVLRAETTCDAYAGLSGLHRLPRWDPAIRRFEHIYDEFGVARNCPNLGRYEMSIDVAAGQLVVGAPIAGLRRKLTEPIADGVSDTSESNLPLQPFPTLGIAAALMSVDHRELLIDAVLVLEPDRSPRACGQVYGEPTCARTAVPLLGLAHLRTPKRMVIGGPLVARVRAGHFEDVRLTRYP